MIWLFVLIKMILIIKFTDIDFLVVDNFSEIISYINNVHYLYHLIGTCVETKNVAKN